MSKIISQRQSVLKQMKNCGFMDDRRTFMLLLLSNKISVAVAERTYKSGQDFKKFILNRKLLTIGRKNENQIIEQLPTSKRA